MDLPLFPLHAVLFPGTAMPLRVFERRYRVLLGDVLAGDRALGVVAISAGLEVGGRAEVHQVGCLATIEDVRRSDDGTADIIVAGRARFRIVERLPEAPYPRARVELLYEEHDAAPAGVQAARAAVLRHLDTLGRLEGNDIAPPALPDDPLHASYELAAAVRVDLPLRQRLLEAPSAGSRLALVEETARREAFLLERIGPSVGRPTGAYSPN